MCHMLPLTLVFSQSGSLAASSSIATAATAAAATTSTTACESVLQAFNFSQKNTSCSYVLMKFMTCLPLARLFSRLPLPLPLPLPLLLFLLQLLLLLLLLSQVSYLGISKHQEYPNMFTNISTYISSKYPPVYAPRTRTLLLKPPKRPKFLEPPHLVQADLLSEAPRLPWTFR